MPNYTYNCPLCGTIERDHVPVEEYKHQVCECGNHMQLVFNPRAVEIRIPLYMQAASEDRFPRDGLQAKTDVEKQMQRDCDARPESKGWN